MYKIQLTSKTEYKKKWKYLINNFVWHAEMILFCITGLKYIKINFTCCRFMRPLENLWLHMLLALYLWDTVLIHWGHQHAIILITCDQSLESTGLALGGHPDICWRQIWPTITILYAHSFKNKRWKILPLTRSWTTLWSTIFIRKTTLLFLLFNSTNTYWDLLFRAHQSHVSQLPAGAVMGSLLPF